jgi:hypothetical protein
MSYRDLAAAAGDLFGGFTTGFHVTYASEMNGEDRLDDLAQAWLDGDRERVLAAVRAHEEAVRARPIRVIVKKVTKKQRIVELGRRGWTTRQIAVETGAHVVYVGRCLRGMPRPARIAWRRADRRLLKGLSRNGSAAREIASLTGLSLSTVYRVLRESTP